MPNRGSLVTGSSIITEEEASWEIKPIKPSVRVIAKYNDGSPFDVPVIGYIRLQGKNKDNEEAPFWVAAVLDPDTGRVYNPTKDTNFLKIDVLPDPEEVTVIGTVTTTAI